MMRRLFRLSGYRPIVGTYEVNGWEGHTLGAPRYYSFGIRIPCWLWKLLGGVR